MAINAVAQGINNVVQGANQTQAAAPTVKHHHHHKGAQPPAQTQATDTAQISDQAKNLAAQGKGKPV